MLYHATILVGGSCLYFLILKETWLSGNQTSPTLLICASQL